MTIQVTVRLPDDLVAHLDAQAQESGDSRASVVARALRLQRQQLLAEADARILERTGDYDDFDGLTASASIDDD